MRLLIQLPSLALMLAVFCLAPAVGADGNQPSGWIWDYPVRFPRPTVPAENPMTAAKVELGRHLFYDTRLSANRTQSCATCHQQKLAFTDGLARSLGSTGEQHPRSSMSLVNVAFTPSLTWADPNLDTLEAQALTPMFGDHPVELGLKGMETELIERIAQEPLYQRLFADAFPQDSISLQTVTRALAAFQRSLVSFRSPYDRYRYQREEGAIGEEAKRGMVIFFSSAKGGCFQCHGGVTFSGAIQAEGAEHATTEFHNTGIYNLSSGPASYPTPNTGLHLHTGKSEDVGKFRAPTLRNIAMTGPYMHDGSMKTLDEVIRHYEAGGRMPNPNKSTILRPFTLTDVERTDLIAFLQSLTDEDALTDPRWSDPWRKTN